MDLSRSTTAVASSAEPDTATLLSPGVPRTAPDDSSGSEGAGIAGLAGGMVRRRGSRVRPRSLPSRRIRLRRDRARLLAWDLKAGALPAPLLTSGPASGLVTSGPATTTPGSRPATSGSFLGTPARPAVPAAGAPSSQRSADPESLAAAFTQAAALLERWDAEAEAAEAAQTARDAAARTAELTDTAEWSLEELSQSRSSRDSRGGKAAPPEAIDLSDNPKLITRPDRLPAPRRPLDAADDVSLTNAASTLLPRTADAPATPGSATPGSATPGSATPGSIPEAGAEPVDTGLVAALEAELTGPDTTFAPAAVITATAPSELAEPMVAALLAIVASLAAWATLAPASVWLPLITLPAMGLFAVLLPGGDTARLIRGGSLLATAAALPALSSAMTPVTLLIAVATVATYPLLTGLRSGRTITASAVLALAAPLVVQAAATGPAAFFDSFTGQQPGALTAVRVALGSGIVVVALIGMSTTATRRMLTSTVRLAADQARTARETAARLGLATTRDEETGLPNRHALLSRLAALLGQHDTGSAIDGTDGTPSTAPAGLAVVEIDRFPMIAGSLGADAAQEVANLVGLRLRDGLPLRQFVARAASHQYAVVLDHATADACAEVARVVRTCLQSPIRAGDDEVSVTCSIGAATQSPALDTAADLLQAADEAVRAAQRRGRSRYLMFDQAVRAHAQSQASLEIELREAIQAGTIGATFQPLLALGAGDQDDRIVGAQALADWTRADGSTVPVQRFSAMADELGLGAALGLHVVELALGALLEWREEGVGVDQVWVNVAPSQLRETTLAHDISARLAVRGLSPSCLVLEVGAADLVESDEALSALSMLRSLGVAIALDDFGRSGTSLTALRSLPISAIKVDHRLGAELGRQDAVPKSITQLCHSLGLRVVVQGVETLVQLRGAREIEADAVQGYAIARPMSAQDVTNLLSLRLPREFRLG